MGAFIRHFSWQRHSVRVVTFLIAILFVREADAQIRIPYRIGDKFGLSDEKGKIKVTAEYDGVYFMEPTFQYFQYTNILPDSIRSVYGGWEPEEKWVTGVIHNDKVLIKDRPYRSFQFHRGHFIVGSMYNSYRPEDCMLFNLKGEELFDSEMEAVYFNYKRDVGKLRYADTNLVLISIFHPDRSKKYKFSIVAYDIQQQKIVQWIIKEVLNFGMIGEVEGESAICVRYEDQSGAMRKRISYNPTTKQFDLSDKVEGISFTDDDEYDRPVRMISSDESIFSTVPAPYPEEVSRVPVKRETLKYYRILGNNEPYFDNEKIQPVPNATYLPAKNGNPQLSPIIYQLGDKYGLLFDSDNRTPAKYDTLFYLYGSSKSGKNLGHLYLTGRKDTVKNTWKFGVINHKDSVVIPIEYDCFIPYIPVLNWEFLRDHFEEPLNYFTSKSKEQKYSSKKENFYNVLRMGLVGEKEGKVGIIDLDNEEVFPFKYDGFYYNDVAFTSPVSSMDDFMIVGKDGKYAMVRDLTLAPKELDKQFIFPQIPSSYYPNYSGKEGFHLVRLIDAEGTFCYASSDGLIFYREK